jgi:hypothetical protein
MMLLDSCGPLPLAVREDFLEDGFGDRMESSAASHFGRDAELANSIGNALWNESRQEKSI